MALSLKKNQDRGSAEPSATASRLQAAPRRPLGKPKTHTGEGTPGNGCKATWRSAAPAQASYIRPLHSESILERLSAGFRSPGTNSKYTEPSRRWIK